MMTEKDNAPSVEGHVMAVVEQSEETPDNKEVRSSDQSRMTTVSSEIRHAPLVEGQVDMVASQDDEEVMSSLEDGDGESKDDLKLWGSLEDHEWFMEKTLEYIPEPGDSLRDNPPPVPDPSTPNNKSVETPGGVTDQGDGHPLFEGTKCSPRGLPILATAGADGVAPYNLTEGGAQFVDLGVVEHAEDDEPGEGRGVVADDQTPPADDQQLSTRSPGMKDVMTKKSSDDLTATPSSSQPETNAGRTTGKDNTLQMSNSIVMRECVHDEKGVCDVHGTGAKEYWRPAKGMVRGRRGSTPTMRHAKEWYWACDLGTLGRGRMRQTSLSSFMKTTSNKKTSTQNTSVPQPDRDNAVLRGDLNCSMTVKKYQ